MTSSALSKLRVSELFEATRMDPSIVAKAKETRESWLALLHHAEAQANGHYDRAQEEYTQAVLWLHFIRENDLWKITARTWTEYFNNWIETGQKGRSMVSESLKAARIWTKGLGRLPEEIMLFKEGISSIEPLFDPNIGLLEEYNNRTGEIEMLRDEWNAKLEGATPADKLNAYINELPKESTKAQTANHVDADTPKVRFEFEPMFENQKPVGVVWSAYDKEGKLRMDGAVAMDELFSIAGELDALGELMGLLHFNRKWRDQ